MPLGDPVRIYVCGMTPKFHPHVGHARLFVVADMIRRTLEGRGYRVRHVQNFTDVDDKIMARAEEEGLTSEQVARKYSDSYFASMAELAVRPAHAYPTVTGLVPQIVAYVEGLVEQGFAYVVGGDVYFEVQRFAGYGKLSGRVEESGMVGVRKELEPGKRDPRDFALWKAAKPGELSWPSPWGAGRPGWHIECSTLVRETLGDQIDLHCGGQDLLFPHHENEIAQSESFLGVEPFARYWSHVGLLTTGGEKMSHSLRNFVTIRDLLERYEPAAVRLYLLQTHYRAPLVFSEEALRAAARGLGALRAAYGRGDESAEGSSEASPVALERFWEQLEDDFNTPGALGVLFETAHGVNRAGESAAGPLRAAFRAMVEVLGLPLDRRLARATGADPFIDLLVEMRAALRAQGQWELADRVRERLKELGVAVHDAREGTAWEFEEEQG